MSRNKGIPNKVTTETKKVLFALFENQTERIESALEEVYSKNKSTYMHLIIKMLPFILPKASEVPTESTLKRPLSWLNELRNNE